MWRPWKIVLAPEGTPADRFVVLNGCGGSNPMPNISTELRFDPTLDAHLTWDAQQPHPTLALVTDQDGAATYAVRGGGCWPTGTVAFRINGISVGIYTGATSPDIDGDCAVRQNDVDYVQSKLGTTDFCADFDGSGTVSQADLAIVQSCLGQRCSQLTDVDPSVPEAAGASFRVAPNPAAGFVAMSLTLPGASEVAIRIIDAGGRLVRDLGTRAVDPGTTVLGWDGSDESGRAVPSGVYLADVRAGERTFRRTILVVR